MVPYLVIIAKDIATNAQVKGDYTIKKLNELKTELNLKDILGKKGDHP